MTPTAFAVRSLFNSGDLDYPPPGLGETSERLSRLFALARTAPIGVARLVEAHTDATAILAEANRCPRPDSLYGVWASQHVSNGVVYDRKLGVAHGTIAFASGLGIVDRALVVARTGDGSVLLDVQLRGLEGSLDIDRSGWSTPALADTATGSVQFIDHPVDDGAAIQTPGWYLERVGFWHGACAPAACWAGGAVGLIDASVDYLDEDPHRRAHHGALLAHEWALESLLEAAARAIDDRPDDRAIAEQVARSLRYSVASICRDVLDRFGRAFGPRPYVQSRDVAQRVADLDLYIKQHHAERELPAISELLVADDR